MASFLFYSCEPAWISRSYECPYPTIRNLDLINPPDKTLFKEFYAENILCIAAINAHNKTATSSDPPYRLELYLYAQNSQNVIGIQDIKISSNLGTNYQPVFVHRNEKKEYVYKLPMPMNLKLHPYKEEQFGKKSGINYEVIKTDYNLNFKPDKREIISVEITLKIKGETRNTVLQC